ncbi:hypothetical protein PIB30_008490 [Stylosanthes scabra]|uniref:Uncharacterized protein n=1 Tax=Stylosanthes scabra TaxID=79078 RepID=A0ABU6Y6M0_9FABA|nr:hypothetical protein [Stylosanthes scabra]
MPSGLSKRRNTLRDISNYYQGSAVGHTTLEPFKGNHCMGKDSGTLTMSPIYSGFTSPSQITNVEIDERNSSGPSTVNGEYYLAQDRFHVNSTLDQGRQSATSSTPCQIPFDTTIEGNQVDYSTEPLDSLVYFDDTQIHADYVEGIRSDDAAGDVVTSTCSIPFVVPEEDNRSGDFRRRTEKGKGLRHAPPQTKKKKKDPMKRTTRKRNREEESSKGKIEEEKVRKKIELKCASVDDLIDKLKAFKGSLHNRGLNTHLVQDHSKWK